MTAPEATTTAAKSQSATAAPSANPYVGIVGVLSDRDCRPFVGESRKGCVVRLTRSIRSYISPDLTRRRSITIQAAQRSVLAGRLRIGASFFFALNTRHWTVPIGIALAAAISWYSHSSMKRSVRASRSRESRKDIQCRNSNAGVVAGTLVEAAR
jgi:hypothetical protein